MTFPQCDHTLHKREQLAILISRFPIEPAYFIVLTIGIVVAQLGVADLVSSQQHGHALGEQESSDKIAGLLQAQGIDCSVIGRSLYSTVPTAVAVCAIAIVFAISLVMFFVVANQVTQGETVVSCDKINAGIGSSAATLVKIAGASYPIR